MTTAVVILSGGVDSTTLLHYVKDRYPNIEFVCLTFDYGQKHVREIECAMFQASGLPHIVMNLNGISIQSVGTIEVFQKMFATSALVGDDVEVPTMEEVEGDPQPSTYVPHRNLLFLTLAAGFAEQVGADRVFYGAQQQDRYGYWDCTPEFVDNLNIVMRLNRKQPITIEAPFVHKRKHEIVEIGVELGVDYAETWSCYEGGEKHCGMCPTCHERLDAFNYNRLVDPVRYAIDLEDII